jgi:hypothetical protein
MSASPTDGATAGDCLVVAGVIEKADGQYILDPRPGSGGPLLQIPEGGVVSHFETGEVARYPGGHTRRVRRVVLRKHCTAIRLEYVTLDEALLWGLGVRPGHQPADSGVLLVPLDDEGASPPPAAGLDPQGTDQA